jgi:hypothetical protein
VRLSERGERAALNGLRGAAMALIRNGQFNFFFNHGKSNADMESQR